MRIAFLLLLISTYSYAADDIGGFQNLLAEKLKEAKPVALVNLKAKPGAAAFLPIHTFHAAYDNGQIDTMKDYVEIGIGYKGQEGEKPVGFAAVDFNIIGLSRRLLTWDWASTHIKSSKFPPIFIGPTLQIPFDIKRASNWSFGDNAGIMGSVRF